jgi:7-cyano-7-deazaguanine synthase in queuosine biosynthesis
MKRRVSQFRVQVRGRGLPEPIEIASGKQFNFDEVGLSESLFLFLNQIELDLVHVVLAVYAVDRLVRKSDASNDRPASRDLELTVEVSDPSFWNSQSSLIERILHFLSDDFWSITFIRGGVALSLPPFLLKPPATNGKVCLYSGGADSAAGLAIRLAESGENFIAVTALHQPQQAGRVRRHVQLMNRQYGQRITSITSRTALVNPPRMDQQELSQRCRSFLFCGLAGAVASTLKLSEIEIYENGIGVLNLPPMTGMLWGGRATRCNPSFLRMMGELVTAVAGQKVVYSLPFKWWTKAEMVRHLEELGLASLIDDTVSCVHFPLRQKGPNQCGLCAGCLGTQQAIIAAGVVSNAEAWREHIMHPQCDSIPTHLLAYLRQQLFQIADLHDLSTDGQSPTILRQHLNSSNVVTITDSPDRWTDLLRRYRDEWMQVIEIGREKGRIWGSWIEGYDDRVYRSSRGVINHERPDQIRPEELQRTACPVP